MNRERSRGWWKMVGEREKGEILRDHGRSYTRVVAQDRWGESSECWACGTCRGGWITGFVIWRFVWLALYAKRGSHGYRLPTKPGH